MGFVYETVTKEDEKLEVALGIKITNQNSIFKSLDTIADQTKENLKSLILTKRGERYMLPEFGTNLIYMLFEPITHEFNDSVKNSITTAIAKWLPYITITEFKIKTILDDPALQHMVEMSLTYTVRNFSTDTIKIFATETGNVTIE